MIGVFLFISFIICSEAFQKEDINLLCRSENLTKEFITHDQLINGEVSTTTFEIEKCKEKKICSDCSIVGVMHSIELLFEVDGKQYCSSCMVKNNKEATEETIIINKFENPNKEIESYVYWKLPLNAVKNIFCSKILLTEKTGDDLTLKYEYDTINLYALILFSKPMVSETSLEEKNNFIFPLSFQREVCTELENRHVSKEEGKINSIILIFFIEGAEYFRIEISSIGMDESSKIYERLFNLTECVPTYFQTYKVNSLIKEEVLSVNNTRSCDIKAEIELLNFQTMKNVGQDVVYICIKLLYKIYVCKKEMSSLAVNFIFGDESAFGIGTQYIQDNGFFDWLNDSQGSISISFIDKNDEYGHEFYDAIKSFFDLKNHVYNLIMNMVEGDILRDEHTVEGTIAMDVSLCAGIDDVEYQMAKYLSIYFRDFKFMFSEYHNNDNTEFYVLRFDFKTTGRNVFNSKNHVYDWFRRAKADFKTNTLLLHFKSTSWDCPYRFGEIRLRRNLKRKIYIKDDEEFIRKKFINPVATIDNGRLALDSQKKDCIVDENKDFEFKFSSLRELTE